MKKELHGKSIVITRDISQSKNLIALITERGGTPLFFPVIKICEPESWIQCDEHLRQIKDFDWIIFSSANGVRFFVSRALRLNIALQDCRIAVVGKKTEAILREFNLKAELIPGEHRAKGLIDSFKSIGVDNQKMLIPTSQIGGEELAQSLSELGVKVTCVTVYRTICNADPEEVVVKTIKKGGANVILFYSPSAVSCFLEKAGKTARSVLENRRTVIAAIGKTTAGFLKEQGFVAEIIPPVSTDEAMVDALCRYYKN